MSIIGMVIVLLVAIGIGLVLVASQGGEVGLSVLQDGVACRLFGTFTEEELENIAESVKVY